MGVRPRFSVLDAIDNLHRLDREFLRELVTKHKSGLEILAGSEQFDPPSVADTGAIEEMFRSMPQDHYIVVDAGSQINSVTVAALFIANSMFLVANPDVPSVRNAQRLLDRVRQLGAGGDRVRLLLNRRGRAVSNPAEADRGGGWTSGTSHVPQRLQGRLDGPELRRATGTQRRLGNCRAIRQLY